MTSKNTTVIDFKESSKTAALYFDYVVPLVFYNEEPLETEVLIKILPKHLLDTRKEGDIVADYVDLQRIGLAVAAPKLLGIDPYETGFINNPEYQLIIKNFQRAANEFLITRGLADSPMLLPSYETPDMGEKREDVLLTLAGIPLVDVTKATWEQILEFRRDEKSVANIRKLRLFLRENYEGKDRSFIEDDLAVRLESYENAKKDWGFKTKTSTISLLLSSKSLIASGGTALVSTLFGAPTVAAAIGATGAIVELGKFGVHIAKRRYGLKNLRRDNALSYIIDAKESFE